MGSKCFLAIHCRCVFCRTIRDHSLLIGGGRGGWVILVGDLKIWPLKRGSPGVIAELWRGALKFYKGEKLTFCSMVLLITLIKI